MSANLSVAADSSDRSWFDIQINALSALPLVHRAHLTDARRMFKGAISRTCNGFSGIKSVQFSPAGVDEPQEMNLKF